MKISIVTVCHKSKIKIKKYVETFVACHSCGGRVEYEFIFVENSGEKDFNIAIEPLIKSGFGVKIIETENNGFGTGCNVGARAACGDVIIFANPDIEFVKNIDVVVDYKEEFWWGTCVQRNIKKENHCVDLMPEHKKLWHEVIGYHKFVNIFPGLFNSKLYVIGSFLIVTKKLYDISGGFNERFFLYYEEAEYCRRLNSLFNGPIIFKSTEIFHSGFGSHANRASIFKHEADGFLVYCDVTDQSWLKQRRLSILNTLSIFGSGVRMRRDALKIALK